MTEGHNFEELMRPREVAEALQISVATLRKYSLIVEKITDNNEYYARTKQKARLYTDKDVIDLRDFKELSKGSSLTLEEAAQQIFGIGDVKVPAKQVVIRKNDNVEQQSQALQALELLQQKLAEQSQAILALQQEMNELREQNKLLLAQPENKVVVEETKLSTDSETNVEAELKETIEVVDEDITDIPTVEVDDLPELEEVEQAQKELGIETESEEKEKAVAPTSDNYAAVSGGSQHRTLVDMQLQDEKKHWWQRLRK